MNLKVYIDKQNNDKRDDFRLRFVDLDSDWKVDKSVGFKNEKIAKKVKKLIEFIISYINSNSI